MTAVIEELPTRAARQRVGVFSGNLKKFGVQVLAAALLLAAWQLASGRIIAELYVSSPQAVADRLIELIRDGRLLPNAWVTFSQAGLGFLVGMVAGIVIGNLMGTIRVLGRVASPYVTFFYTMPRIAIAPLFVIWLGVGFNFKAAFVAFVVVFIFITPTYAGLSSMDPDLASGIKVMGASRWKVIWMAIFPQQVLWITTTVKLALPTAIATDITAEFVASHSGLGFMMNDAAGILDTASLLAEVVFISIVVTALLGIVSLVEHRWFRWRNAG
jgi:NitT/TauT family transport system permease protein